ncbi:MAG: DUF4743 domain-containing protein [Magnetospirillum sp. WYHS-4]
MSFLDRIRACNVADLARYRPFRVADADVGLVRDDFARIIEPFPDVFGVSPAAVVLNPGLASPAERTRAVDHVLRRLREEGHFPHWREELYPVAAGFGRPSLFAMERAAVARFGVLAYGLHLNGYVRGPDGSLRMWIGRRACDRPLEPGKLDQMVAGGQPAGLTLAENLAKECAEEAGMPADLVRRALPVGAVSYILERPEGLRRDVLFNYDIELPADFRPRNTDGEIAEFILMSMDEIVALVRDTDEFKFNCSVVLIDFLIRHGILAPEHPDYLELLLGLHRF